MEQYNFTELGISQDRINAVNHNELLMSKVSARCVSKFLGPDLKQTGLKMSRKIFEADPNSFLQKCVTMDETWVHQFQPERKQQSKQWKHLGTPPSKEAKTVMFAGKV